MLEVRNISFGYTSERLVLDSVGFTAQPGEVVAVLGNNGAGKSTLIKCMDRILTPRSGEVISEGQELLSLGRRELARVCAYVPQTPPGGTLTVFDSVLLGRRPYITWDASPHDREVAMKALGRMGLDGLALRRVDELSGGERQKAALARALAQEPRLMLLDEPTSALDPHNQHETMRVVRELAREKNICAVCILHDLNLAVRYCDRFLFLRGARVFACGGREVMTSENIEEVYGMHVHIVDYMGIPLVVPFPEIQL